MSLTLGSGSEWKSGLEKEGFRDAHHETLRRHPEKWGSGFARRLARNAEYATQVYVSGCLILGPFCCRFTWLAHSLTWAGSFKHRRANAINCRHNILDLLGLAFRQR